MSNQKMLDGKVVVVTGAGRGIGRGHCLHLAEQGASVIINDIDTAEAQKVADEITANGGAASINGDDISKRGGAKALIAQCVDEFGEIHIVVNNAGNVRDRSFLKMTDDEFDSVFRVHVKGTFMCSQEAALRMRAQGTGGSIVNTVSAAHFGNFGQTNYGAAKMGIAAFTIIAARELGRYGVTVNCIAPGALTRLSEDLQPGAITDEMREAQSPRWIAPIVTWLASGDSSDVTGRVFEASGRVLAVAEGWHRGPSIEPVQDPTVLGPIVRKLVGDARLNAGMNGTDQDGGLG